jgi:integrase
MNKTTIALSDEQYKSIIQTIVNGFLNSRPNKRVATALTLEANLGMRISDILNLKLDDIVKEAGRYRLDIVEQKTQKKRCFTIPKEIYNYISDYALDLNIKRKDPLFDITERAVQKHLKNACDYLGIEGIGTHSFRKFFATSIYKDNDYNIVLVQQLLQHSSPAVTQRYIGISQQEIERALNNHIYIV